MKTILSITLFALIAFSAKAQDTIGLTKTKGTYMVNGSVLVASNTTNINDESSSSFNLTMSPKLGYFIKENLAMGAELKSSYLTQTEDSGFGDTETTTILIGLAPFARYYISDAFFGELAAGVATQNTKIEGGLTDNELKGMTFGFRVGAGYSISMSNSVAIEPMFNYTWEKFNPNDAPDDYKETISSLFLGVGITGFF